MVIFCRISVGACEIKTPGFCSDVNSFSPHDQALVKDLTLLNFPPRSWIKNCQAHLFDYDVVIIGAGMSGLTAGAALFKEGIFNIKIFDQNTQGQEGPWVTYARMQTLRSSKDLMGPALEIPHLTFRAWFESQWGEEAWRLLGKIPNGLWMDYLNWYRQVMQLPVENNSQLIALIPSEGGFTLEFLQAGRSFVVKTRKVILATGRSGFGGPRLPDFVKELPRSAYAHTIESIDFDKLKNRRVGVIGAGASAFDAAAVALEKGAKQVDLLMRRTQLPAVNKIASLSYKGFIHGYFRLSKEERWDFMTTAFSAGIPPPIDALKRLQGYKNFCLRSQINILEAKVEGSVVCLKTNQETYCYDFLIFGTGFQIDGYQRPELKGIIDQIALWSDRLPAEKIMENPLLGRFPDLGPYFEFLSKEDERNPYLKNLHCFNYGAMMSHGLLNGDIPNISLGAKRLAEGIAGDFFLQDSKEHLEKLKSFQDKDFDQKAFFAPCQK